MALKLALDGNRYTDFVQGVPDAVHVLSRADEIWLPFIVAAELRAGFRGGSRGATNEQKLVTFLQGNRVSMLLPDAATTHYYAGIYVELRRAGTPIPTNDMWIAALALQHDLVLFSRDRHFDRVPRIPRI
jgi:predicted nucleic acid-binding protein